MFAAYIGMLLVYAAILIIHCLINNMYFTFYKNLQLIII